MRTASYQTSMLVTGVATLVAATMLVWLFLTEPVALASAVADQDLSELARAVGRAIRSSLETIVRYL